MSLWMYRDWDPEPDHRCAKARRVRLEKMTRKIEMREI